MMAVDWAVSFFFSSGVCGFDLLWRLFDVFWDMDKECRMRDVVLFD